MATYVDWMRSCSDITVTGRPVISMPAAFTADGLPVGVQFVARRGADVELLRFAKAGSRQWASAAGALRSRHVSELHRNVVRVVEAGRALGLVVQPRRFPEGARTAVDAANAIGCEVGQIVKSLIFGVDGEIVLAYVSGSNQLDEAKLAAAAGGLMCQRVDADVVREATGFPIGGVPPIGHATPLRVFIDPDLLEARCGLGRRRHLARRVPARPARAAACQRRDRGRDQAGQAELMIAAA